MYQVTQNKDLYFIGSEDECYIKLQAYQGNSANWAMRYEGYKIEPFNKADYNKAIADYDKLTGQYEDATENEKTTLSYNIKLLEAAINKYERA